jgi:hypothetical protein
MPSRRCVRHRCERGNQLPSTAESVELPDTLGSSVPGVTQGVTKASVLSNHLRVEPSRIAGDRTVTLAMPEQSTLPILGTKCGRRERESRREGAGGAILRRQEFLNRIPSRVVAAKGIPVFWKAARFAVRRWNGGLGRLVIGFRGFLRGVRARR